MAIEKPEYQVLLKEKLFELRRYKQFITADFEVEAEDRLQAANQGFRALANFIFGNNISREKISMTAPVTAVPSSEKISMTAPVTVSGSGRFMVSFTMPASYTLDSLPKPLDSRIEINQHSENHMAVIRFSGFFNEKNFSRHELLLEAWLQKKGIQTSGLPVVAGYDPPFMPWFLKHNEIMVEYQP